MRGDGYPQIDLNVHAGDFTLWVARCVADEKALDFFDVRLDLMSETPYNVKDLAGKSAKVSIEINPGELRWFHGLLWEVSQALGEVDGFYQYEATLLPWIEPFKHHLDCRLFQNKSAVEIIQQLFREINGDLNINSLQSQYPTLVSTAQYQESTWQFIRRLMIQSGITGYFVHDSHKSTFTLSDDFTPGKTHALQLKRASCSYTKKQKTLYAESVDESIQLMDWVKHPAPHNHQRFQIQALTHRIEDCKNPDPSIATPQDLYRNHFLAYSHAADLGFAPSPKTGMQTAIVTGPKGDVIYTNERGETKIQFQWDREGKFDEHSSPWIPNTQGWSGDGRGFQQLPHIGHEVGVQFLEGDINQPVVDRSFPNKNNPPVGIPNDLVAKDGYSDIAGNSLYFNEDHSHAILAITAKKDLIRQSKKAWRQQVDGNLTHTVGGNSTTTIEKGFAVYQANSWNLGVGKTQMTLDQGVLTIKTDKLYFKKTGAGGGGAVKHPICLGDAHICPQSSNNVAHSTGTVISASSDVTFYGKPVACEGDKIQCQDGSTATIQPGNSCVTIHGKKIALDGDQTDHGGVLQSSCSNVFIEEGEVFMDIGVPFKTSKPTYFVSEQAHKLSETLTKKSSTSTQ